VGIFLAVLAVPLILVSPISGRLSDKIGSRFLSVLGMGIIFSSLHILRHPGLNAGYLQVMVGIIMLGIGMAVFQVPNNNALMGAVSSDMLGTASAIYSTVRNIGSSSAIAVASSFFSIRETYYLKQLSMVVRGTTTSNKIASAMSYQDTLVIAISISFFGILSTLVQGAGQTHKHNVRMIY